MRKQFILFLSAFIFLVYAGKAYSEIISHPRSSSWNVSTPEISEDDTTVQVSTNIKGAVYQRDEPIVFEIKVFAGEKNLSGEVAYAITLDGASVLQKGTLELVNGSARVYWQSSLPSIITCQVTYSPHAVNPISGLAAAAVDPYHIMPTANSPDDFAVYWERAKSRLLSVPVNAKMTKLKSHQPEIYDITLDNINGSKVHGYFGKPAGKGPYPAILLIPGAGVGDPNHLWVEKMVSQGFMAMAISVHDLPNGQSDEFYKQKYATTLEKYYLQGREDRDKYYYHRVIMGCIRSLDFLTGRDEWDKRHMIINGSSQGGGLALITTGLDSRVTAATVNVPALCDHSGRDYGRPSGWPQLVPELPDKKLDPKILRVASYYDAVNFARLIRVPVIFSVGLIDRTCHPTTVFSAYNVITSKKEIDIAPLMGHNFNPAFLDMQETFNTIQSKN